MSKPEARVALVVGSTGLVGRHLVDLLLNSENYSEVRTLVRRPSGRKHPKLLEAVFDFDKPDREQVRGDDVFCCLGTTMKKAGSKEAFCKVDHDYPLETARLAKENGARRFLIVTAMGADPDSSFFYNRVKGKVEEELKKAGYDVLHIFRPSLLLGDRDEQRLGERVGALMMNVFRPLMVGPLKKYRAIRAEKVSIAMLTAAAQGSLSSPTPSVVVHESGQMQKL